MKPRIVEPVAPQIDIDSGVSYQYVVPVDSSGSIVLSFVPNSDFNLSISGSVLTLKFKSAPPAIATTYPVVIQATNADGVASQTLNLRVQPNLISTTPSKFTATADPSGPNYTFVSGRQILRVNDAVFFGGVPFYVVAVGADNFRISATSGGSPITPTTAVTNDFQVYTTSDASDAIWIGDTSKLSFNQAIILGFSAGKSGGGALEANLTAKVFVAAIVDPYHVKVSASPGGGIITPTALAFTFNNVVATDASGVRTIPGIVSSDTVSVGLGGALVYAIATDISADSFEARGLPSWITLSGAVLSGTAPNLSSSYAVTLIARKSDRFYRRYLLVLVGSGGVFGRTTDNIFTWRT